MVTNGVVKYNTRNKKFKHVKYFQKTTTFPTLTGVNPLPLSTLDDNGVAYANFWNLHTVYHHEIPPFVSRGYFPVVTGVSLHVLNFYFQ